VTGASPHGQLTTPDGAPRVVVTGTGMLTALGADVESTWAGLVAGRSGIAKITAFDPARVPSRIAGEVPGLDPSGVLDRKEQRRTDRYTHLALVAAREALDEAGFPGRLEGELAERTGILIATGLGGGITFGEQVTTSVEKGPDRVSPFFVPMAIPNVAAGQAAIFFGALGPNYAIASACASGGHAVGEAWEIIRRGRDAGRIRGSGHLGAARGGLRGHARALHAQRRPDRRLAPVRSGP
jgi:3-oxoacyl-[acyl-carrier-protein] synthase II